MFPPLPVTIYAVQVRKSDKKSKVWLSDLFELQEFLISFLSVLLVEEEDKRLWFISGWEDRGEVTCYWTHSNVIIIIIIAS